MNALDVLIALLAVSAVAAGYRLGFAQRILAWIGLVAGLLLALRLLPMIAGSDETATTSRFLRATAVFVVATLGLRVYLNFITRTGYTYGALATPIAFLLFAFFLGLAIMLGAELNNAIQEEWPAAATHADRVRGWLVYRRNGGTDPAGEVSPS